MDRQESNRENTFNLMILLVGVAVLAVLIVLYPHKFGSLLIALLGFGAVILVHEFGHFIVAKLSGIKVEAFSIGFPPTLVGLRRKRGGWDVRFLPRRRPAEEAGAPEAGRDLASEDGRVGETEYRLGLVPFGGFVKMLGQEDAGVAEESEDPRSFANKSVWIRIAVVAAGVVFNAISASLIFMIVFLIGMDLPPAVVGGVMPGSPADRAGLQPGDRIVQVEGESFIDYTALVLAPALSKRGEPIHFVVEHPDGTREPMEVVAESSPRTGERIRTLGIQQAESLTVPRSIDEKTLAEAGLKPGDRIVAMDGRPVDTAWEMDDIIRRALKDKIVITLERTDPKTTQTTQVDVPFDMAWAAEQGHYSDELNLCHVHSLVPRLKVAAVAAPRRAPLGWLLHRLSGGDDADDPAERLQPGDVLLKVGAVENPTYAELRRITQEHRDKELAITVLRKDEDGNEQQVEITTVPRSDPRHEERAVIGFVPMLDMEHPVVAATLGEGDLTPLAVPRGATITTVDGEPVASWADVVRLYRASHGQRISLEYRLDGEDAGAVALIVPEDDRFLTVHSTLAEPLPLEPLKETYQAGSPLQAVRMGLKKTSMFIVQTYVTLQRLITGDVSPSNLMGPVGILRASYTIAQRDLIDYVYFLGLISSIIAVMNLLPLPIVDGGVIVLLLIEKIKGSPLNERIQGVINYAGLAFLLAVLLWLTYQDLLRVWFD